MIKLPSITTLWQTTYQAIVRFPIQFIIIIIAVGLWWLAIDNPDGSHSQTLYSLLAVCNFAFCITLASDLFSEIRSLTIGKRWLFRILSLGFSLLLFFILSPKWVDEDLYRIGLFILAGHLLLSFLPFSKKNNDHALWQYNKLLLLRFLTAIFYSGALFVGLVIALLSVENLFNLTIDGTVYSRLFGVIGIGFNTLFFLTGIPKNIHSIETDEDYPKGLKLFTQYVLIPLVTVYLAILLSYEFKIILEQSLPQGLVSILILGYAVLGILAYLLIYPIKERADHEWIKTFSRLFFYFMIPLLILLFVAIETRISNYGITESRYFLIVLALWLSGITVYFLISKSPSIQIIPASLCALAVLSTFGPQSASSITKKSQISRYQSLGNDEDSKKQKASIIHYMTRTHGLRSLQALTSVDLNAVQQEILAHDTNLYIYQTKSELLDSAYSILAIKPSYYQSSLDFITVELEKNPIDISGYEQLVEFDSYSKPADTLRQQDDITIRLENTSIKLRIGKQDSTAINLNAFYQTLRETIDKNKQANFNSATNSYLLPDSALRLSAESPHYLFSLVFKTLNIPSEDAKENHSFSGILLLKKKENLR